jgi:hypothetical protein
MAMTINGSTGVVYPDGTSQASGQQACKAWVNFDGTGTVAIRAAYNITSITDLGTGYYTLNFTTAMSDANYAVVFGGWNNGAGNGGWISTGIGSGSYPAGIATAAVTITNYSNGGALQDNAAIYVSVFR